MFAFSCWCNKNFNIKIKFWIVKHAKWRFSFSRQKKKKKFSFQMKSIQLYRKWYWMFVDKLMVFPKRKQMFKKEFYYFIWLHELWAHKENEEKNKKNYIKKFCSNCTIEHKTMRIRFTTIKTKFYSYVFVYCSR